jgi:transposase-like protein
MLLLQAFSELFKRIAFLKGLGPDPTERFHEKSPEELLAEELRKQRAEIEETDSASSKADPRHSSKS